MGRRSFPSKKENSRDPKKVTTMERECRSLLWFLHRPLDPRWAPFDLVITDPPLGTTYFYADLSDFFYVWLRLPLLKWYTVCRTKGL